MRILTDLGKFVAIFVIVAVGVFAVTFALWGPKGLLVGG